MKQSDVIVLGGGAAGLFVAGDLIEAGKDVFVIEGNEKVGKKILISGGGRANFTNLEVTAAHFRSANPHFSKSALACYQPHDFITEIINANNIPFYEKKLGQLFCERKASDLVEALCSRIDESSLITQSKIESVTFEKTHFVVHTSTGAYTAKNVVVATGGLSIPKIGSSGIGYNIAKHFGHSLEKRFAALDGFVLPKEKYEAWTQLSGVSSIVSLRCPSGPPFTEDLLFTHRGLSGPVALKASLYWNQGETLECDFLPNDSLEKWYSKASSKQKALDAIKDHLPKRLWETLSTINSNINKLLKIPRGSLSDAQLRQLISHFHHYPWLPSDTVGYQKAEVTRGGVNVDEIDSKSMESRKQKGLYFIGEVLDVTGWLGGYNFHWAWASARAASIHILSQPKNTP